MNVQELRIGSVVSSNDHQELTVKGIIPDEKWDGGYKIMTDKMNIAITCISPIN